MWKNHNKKTLVQTWIQKSNSEKDDGGEGEESHAAQRLVSDKAPLDFRSMETNFIYR